MTQNTAEELVTITNELRTRINIVLNELGGPEIGLSNNQYDRVDTFVKFNDWLYRTTQDNVLTLTEQFGLLPMSFSLSGIDPTAAALIQKTHKINLRGHIRYVSMALGRLTGTNTDDIISVGNELFGKTFSTDALPMTEARLKFITTVLEYFIATPDDITYEQSLTKFLDLID